MIFCQMLKEVCSDVEIEPRLQPLDGESLPGRSANTEQESRLDILVRRVWGGCLEKTFLTSESLILIVVFTLHRRSTRCFADMN